MPRRLPLTPIAANRRPGTELSNEDKSRIWGRALAGQSGDEIATAESLHKRTVNSLLKRANTRHTLENKPRPGQPKSYTPQDARRIVRYARLHPKWTYQDLQRYTGLELHRTTFRSILNDHGIINWRCKKRLHLTQTIATLRL